ALLEQSLEARDDGPVALLAPRPEEAGRDAGAFLGVGLLHQCLELGGHAAVGLVVEPAEVGAAPAQARPDPGRAPDRILEQRAPDAVEALQDGATRVDLQQGVLAERALALGRAGVEPLV